MSLVNSPNDSDATGKLPLKQEAYTWLAIDECPLDQPAESLRGMLLEPIEHSYGETVTAFYALLRDGSIYQCPIILRSLTNHIGHPRISNNHGQQSYWPDGPTPSDIHVIRGYGQGHGALKA